MELDVMFRLCWQILSVLLLLDGLGEVYTKGDTDIKIVDASARSNFPPLPSSGPKSLSLRIKPANISGPPHLQQLAGQCFSTSEKGYTYEVCSFKNVTQKEDRVGWNSFYGVLGVWREWVIANDTFTGMKFAVGERCGSKDREAEVRFNCSTITRLHNVTEPRTCSYVVWMDTPLACFKGAMQVYHVLSVGDLKQWDRLELEYHSGEITFQGLTKRRKKLFIVAGLQYDPEKEEVVKKEEKPTEAEPLTPEAPPTVNPIVQCVIERQKLEKELKELKDVVEQVARDHPALASKFSFLKNISNDTEAARSSPHRQEEMVESPREVPQVVEDSKPLAANVEGGDVATDNNTHADKAGHRDQQKEDLARGGVDAHGEPVKQVSDVQAPDRDGRDSERVEGDIEETAEQKLQQLLNDVELQDMLNEVL